MFRIVGALFLINFYCGIWGAPTPNEFMVSDLLNDLAIKCNNQFLSTQIQNKTKDCHLPVPPYHEKQFECLLFYDINKQLCEAIATSKLALNDDFTTAISKDQDVSLLCNIAKNWTFSDISEDYKKTVQVVFQNPVKCSKVCSIQSDDILIEDSSFFCKYFKWGSEILKSDISIGSAVANSTPLVSAVDQSINIANTGKIEESVIQNKVPEIKTEINSAPAPTKQPNDADTKIPSENPIPINISNLEPALQTPVVNKVEENPAPIKQFDSVSVSAGTKTVEVQPIILPGNSITSSNMQQNLSTQKEVGHKDETTSNASKNVVENVKKENAVGPKNDIASFKSLGNQLENPKPKDFADEYQVDIDSDEGKDGLPDNQGDEMDDSLLTDHDQRTDQLLNNKPMKSNDASIYTNSISAKEIYPNTIPDGFGEDDDHFFPFFLTAIIMVILLYVLYHNKSKVTKVVLGLIVEGRQPGRRRNSRGHAYRRLDTLEQAMSANTAAPPSKIIY